MKHHVILLVSTLGMPLSAAAQNAPASNEEPEEIIVVGQRTVMKLRLEMWNLEKRAYEVFNTFNDEKRFDISCSAHQISGTRVERQLCQPEFEIQALAQHGRGYLDSYRAFMEGCYMGNCEIPPPTDGAPTVSAPATVVIASQQQAYRAKMKQIAEEHPEFLEALIDYSEARARYEAATSTGDNDDNDD